ncbi:FliM/FliN family flagellar motor switch protein [Woodsholea maritima]|uniref:FliM/FliN family flagellar motor switch protein n=1 Tax=Woodsholea maritima TaxID=240237 RepID=UPI00035E2E4C|nr:FliM/FliN family flagellar motor C-terminal domain-containing protein [Woodsholea maritima]
MSQIWKLKEKISSKPIGSFIESELLALIVSNYTEVVVKLVPIEGRLEETYDYVCTGPVSYFMTNFDDAFQLVDLLFPNSFQEKSIPPGFIVDVFKRFSRVANSNLSILSGTREPSVYFGYQLCFPSGRILLNLSNTVLEYYIERYYEQKFPSKTYISFEQLINDIPVQVSGKLCEIPLPLQTVLNLKAGEVVPLPYQLDDELELYVNNQCKLEAKLVAEPSLRNLAKFTVRP